METSSNLQESNLRLELQEWQRLTPDSYNHLAGRFLDREPDVRLAVDKVNRAGQLEIVELIQGLQISTFQYVGSLRLGSLHIIIRPKLTGAPLLNLLRYAYNLRSLFLFTSIEFGAEESTFQDLLIHQLGMEVRELLGRGLYRRYERMLESLVSPRGRIDFGLLALRGGIKEASLPCTHYLRLEDNIFNRILLAGLYLGTHITNDLELRSQLHQLAGRMEDSVSTVPLSIGLLEKAWRNSNRLTSVYRPSFTIIKLLLTSQGISLDYRETIIKVPGFLFDMNRFFQALIERFLKENLPGYEVREENRLRGMLTYDSAHNPRLRRAPTPRPDFAILRDRKTIALLDTKYRDLWEQDLPREMLYQLALYAFSQEQPGCAVILYPTINKIAKESWIEIHHPLTGTQLARVILRPVDLYHLEDLITAPTTVMRERQRSQYAQKLAFG